MVLPRRHQFPKVVEAVPERLDFAGIVLALVVLDPAIAGQRAHAPSRFVVDRQREKNRVAHWQFDLQWDRAGEARLWSRRLIQEPGRRKLKFAGR